MDEMNYRGIKDVKSRIARVGLYLYVISAVLAFVIGVFLFAIGFCYMMTAMQNVGTTSFVELVKLWCTDGVALFDMPVLGEVPRYIALQIGGIITFLGGIAIVYSFCSTLEDLLEAQECLDFYKSRGYACIEGA